ncbi:hypothetical protein I314_04795 [Cryptococcus bacillisporus CA1873]|uniref:Uncharacterized protein n=1 Tax=Cryptococcus bacillisporus CA1873 TaxID=1296111 RepID=A0ABR5B6S2_CRYGA|nr:hypothetical protein I314_04795 [Cryptococcus bacillisporus CA1873]|eukprot:KIR59280.1 hypothetical protein I314_04795 [Cryptococcus gattii CA1873]
MLRKLMTPLLNLLEDTDSPFDSIVPIFQWPFILLASFLQFTFLYSSGIEELQKDFASGQSAAKVKSILTVFVVTSTLQLVPSLIFDTHYHFKALWGFSYHICYLLPHGRMLLNRLWQLCYAILFLPLFPQTFEFHLLASFQIMMVK